MQKHRIFPPQTRRPLPANRSSTSCGVVLHSPAIVSAASPSPNKTTSSPLFSPFSISTNEDCIPTSNSRVTRPLIKHGPRRSPCEYPARITPNRRTTNPLYPAGPFASFASTNRLDTRTPSRYIANPGRTADNLAAGSSSSDDPAACKNKFSRPPTIRRNNSTCAKFAACVIASPQAPLASTASAASAGQANRCCPVSTDNTGRAFRSAIARSTDQTTG